MAVTNEEKIFSETNMRKIITMLRSLMTTSTELAEQCINEYEEAKVYEQGRACFYNNVLYKARTTTTGPFDINKWDVIDGTTVDELTAEDIDALMSSVSSESWDYLSTLIQDDSISTTHLFSSSKIYMSIQAAIKECKDDTLAQIAKKVSGSYRIATSVDDVVDNTFMYLISNGTNYDIYVLVEGTPTKVGDTTIDLSSYLSVVQAEAEFLKKTDAEATYAKIEQIDDKVDKTNILSAKKDAPVSEEVYNAEYINNNIGSLHSLASPNNDIPENADLNDYIVAGDYKCGSSTTTKTLVNCPIINAFKMIVERMDNNVLAQYIIVVNNTASTVWYRYMTYGNVWNPWKKIATDADIANHKNIYSTWASVGITDLSTISSLLDISKKVGDGILSIQVDGATKSALYPKGILPEDTGGVLHIRCNGRGYAIFTTDSQTIYVSISSNINSAAWSKWKKIGLTTVADIANTVFPLIANDYVEINGTANPSYYVKNGYCTIVIELKPIKASTTVFVPIASGLPKAARTFFNNVIDRNLTTAVALLKVGSDGTLAIIHNASATTSRFYTEIVYPVAES